MTCNRRESPSPYLLKSDQSSKALLCPLGPQRQEQGITSTQLLGGALLFAGAIKCHVACNPWETASSPPTGASTTTPLCLLQGHSSKLTHRSSSCGEGWCCLLGLSEKAQHQTVFRECSTIAANPLSEAWCMEASGIHWDLQFLHEQAEEDWCRWTHALASLQESFSHPSLPTLPLGFFLRVVLQFLQLRSH